ncbi:hypothetical protein M514_18316 [Trichuris suis]|uniref:Uncharacterized protein n=1 Tax=Trichuris suis TaxID=68888 RepID=A0A085NIZ8_9BILA|nr:hypothetical protein M514_18316 [Trichuris suis]
MDGLASEQLRQKPISAEAQHNEMESHIQWRVSKSRATFININAKLLGLSWARHQREVCRSPGRPSCLQAPPSDRLRHGPQLSALTLSRRALVPPRQSDGGASAQPTERGGDTTTNE